MSDTLVSKNIIIFEKLTLQESLDAKRSLEAQARRNTVEDYRYSLLCAIAMQRSIATAVNLGVWADILSWLRAPSYLEIVIALLTVLLLIAATVIKMGGVLQMYKDDKPFMVSSFSLWRIAEDTLACLIILPVMLHIGYLIIRLAYLERQQTSPVKVKQTRSAIRYTWGTYAGAAA